MAEETKEKNTFLESREESIMGYFFTVGTLLGAIPSSVLVFS